MTPPSSRHPALLLGAVVVLAVATAGLVLLLTGRDAPEEVEVVATPPVRTPEATPTPEPTPTPGPVHGALDVAGVTDLSTAGTGLFQEGQAEDQPIPVDEGALDAFVTDLRNWLDDLLTRVHTDGDVDDIISGLTGPEELLSLGDADHIIDEARYLVTVGVRGTPEWADVAVTVTRSDGSERAVHLAVLPGTPPVLVAAGPADPAAPAVEAENDA